MSIVRALQRFADRLPQSAPEAESRERCEICGVAVDAGHPHLFAIERRALLCACIPCATLFSDGRASGGRYQRIPDRVLVDVHAQVDDAAWGAVGVPVGLAFIVCDATRANAVAFYPSPAGPVQSDLPGDAWKALQERTPLARVMEPDIEALLVRRSKNGQFDCMLAPVDVCFALVGEVRRRWRGFDGGDDARGAIDSFFERLRAKGRPVEPERKGATP
jgi:hypothetical protein